MVYIATIRVTSKEGDHPFHSQSGPGLLHVKRGLRKGDKKNKEKPSWTQVHVTRTAVRSTRFHTWAAQQHDIAQLWLVKQLERKRKANYEQDDLPQKDGKKIK